MHNGTPEKIRLNGIDCPERGQAFGNRAKQFTGDMVFGKTVTIKEYDNDKYGRTIGDVLLSDGTNLNKELLRQGFAWWYRQYSNDKELEQLEQEARLSKKGLWSDPKPVAPGSGGIILGYPATRYQLSLHQINNQQMILLYMSLSRVPSITTLVVVILKVLYQLSYLKLFLDILLARFVTHLFYLIAQTSNGTTIDKRWLRRVTLKAECETLIKNIFLTKPIQMTAILSPGFKLFSW